MKNIGLLLIAILLLGSYYINGQAGYQGETTTGSLTKPGQIRKTITPPTNRYYIVGTKPGFLAPSFLTIPDSTGISAMISSLSPDQRLRITTTKGTIGLTKNSGGPDYIVLADSSLANEGLLSVQAGGVSSSVIRSNTSTSPDITVNVAGDITVSESGNSLTLGYTDGDKSSINEIQTISKVGYTIYLSSGGNVHLDSSYVSSVTGTANKVTASPTSGNVVISLPSIVHITSNLSVGNTSPLAPIHVGNQNLNNSTDCQILISRTTSGSGNGHGFADATDFSRSGSSAYASYDTRMNFSGANNFDHFVGYQAAPTFTGSGTMTNMYGSWFTPAMSGGGTISNCYGYYTANAQPITGTISNNYGVYVEALNRGAVNYAFFSAGSTPSSFGGNTSIGGTTTSTGTIFANSVGANIRVRADGTTAKDGGIFAGSGGDIYYANYDGNRGFLVGSSGNSSTVGSGTFTSTGPFIANTIATVNSTLNANGVNGNIRIKSDGTTAKDGGIFANSSGDIYFSNWDANRGLILKSSSDMYTMAGKLGLVVTSPTAILHIKAGTTAANTAPLKFNSGTLMASPEAGAVEYDGSILYYTNSTPTRIPLVGATRTINTVSPIIGGNSLANDITISTSMATNRLTGRYSAGSGVMQEIKIGAGLALHTDTLVSTISTSGGTVKHIKAGSAFASQYGIDVQSNVAKDTFTVSLDYNTMTTRDSSINTTADYIAFSQFYDDVWHNSKISRFNLFKPHDRVITTSKAWDADDSYGLVVFNGALITFTLPASPDDKETVSFYNNVAANFPTVNGNGKNINGAGTFVFTSQYETHKFMYLASLTKWIEIP